MLLYFNPKSNRFSDMDSPGRNRSSSPVQRESRGEF